MIQKLPKWLWRCCRCLCCNQKTRKEVDSKLTDLQNQYRMQIAKSAAAVGLLLSAAYRFYQVAGDTFMERIQRDVVLVTWEVMLLTVTVLIASGRMTCWRFMNLAYFLLMLLLSVSLLPGMIGGRHLVMAISMTWLLRCSIVPLTNSVRLVVFSNLVCHLCMRVATEWTRDRNTPELRTPRGPRADFYVRFVDNSLAIDTALSLLSCLISAWLEHTTCSIVEKSLENSNVEERSQSMRVLIGNFLRRTSLLGLRVALGERHAESRVNAIPCQQQCRYRLHAVSCDAGGQSALHRGSESRLFFGNSLLNLR